MIISITFIFLKHFCEYHTEKLKYRDVTCVSLKVLPWWICYYCFCSHIQALEELESAIVATHTACYTESKYSLTFLAFISSFSKAFSAVEGFVRDATNWAWKKEGEWD